MGGRVRVAAVGAMFPSSLLLRSLLLCFVLSLCSSSVAGLPFSQANLVVPVVLPYANIALTRVQVSRSAASAVTVSWEAVLCARSD